MEIIETWNSMAMRGTGSHDIEFADTFISDERLIGPRRGRRGERAWRATVVRAGYRLRVYRSGWRGVPVRGGLCETAALAPVAQYDRSPSGYTVLRCRNEYSTRSGTGTDLQNRRGNRPRHGLRYCHVPEGHNGAILRHSGSAGGGERSDASRRRPERLPALSAGALLSRCARRHPASVYALLATRDDRQVHLAIPADALPRWG